ncbi:DinB/UmuC family translesion DNA polymerase [Bacillus pacificus]
MIEKLIQGQMGQHKSVGNSMTFSKDMDEEKELLDMLERLSKSVSKRLQKANSCQL